MHLFKNEEAYELLLYQYEDNIPYRTISPRHFEASALRLCQILLEGKYSGVMRPMVHYIPLKKDFSNFDEVRIWIARDSSQQLSIQCEGIWFTRILIVRDDPTKRRQLFNW